MQKVEICLSPELLHLYHLQEKSVVVVDIFRATSCMVTALSNGIKSILPVASVKEAESLRNKGHIAAAERNGQKVEGFDLGNSPLEYLERNWSGESIVITTTNGTRAIVGSQEAQNIYIGAFLSLEALVNHLKNEKNDLTIVCAGWKGKVNLEDTLFAGALIENLKDSHEPEDDSSLIARHLFLKTQDDLIEVLKESSHYQRLSNLGIEKDIKFCLQTNIYDTIPVLKEGQLQAL